MNTRKQPVETTLEQIRRRIECADEAPTLLALAQTASLSPGHLCSARSTAATATAARNGSTR
ncbi:MAG: hypothetical protein ACYCZD_08835 [Rhodanobacter sp.]